MDSKNDSICLDSKRSNIFSDDLSVNLSESNEGKDKSRNVNRLKYEKLLNSGRTKLNENCHEDHRYCDSSDQFEEKQNLKERKFSRHKQNISIQNEDPSSSNNFQKDKHVSVASKVRSIFENHSKSERKSSDLAKNRDKIVNFPFNITPSGNLKIQPEQVIYNSKKVSIVVAEPGKTQINIGKELDKAKIHEIMPLPSKLFQAPPVPFKMEEAHRVMMQQVARSEGARVGPPLGVAGGTGEGPDYDTDADSIDSLKPEMNLERLGYTNSLPIDYTSLTLPTKTNLYQELHRRISNYLNTDVQVIIGQEEFSCHSMVLQSYSEFFEKNYGVKRLELPLNEVSVNSFVIIYDWMITGQDGVRLLKRENIIDVFIASRFLGIKELEEQCWAFVDSEEVFSEDTAFILYKEAKKRGIHAVKDLMIPRIRNFFLILVASQDFVELDPEEIVVILSSNYIAVNCEMEVLMSAVRWLKYDWENRLQHLVPVMTCVRFGLIAPWQLVDIKRNPENPELLEIMTVPEISKMVDDGLSFVIIKYWYGHQSDDYAHWIELLGLTEPTERNWAGTEKSYVTYRQFLGFLDSYRREHLLEKSRSQTRRATDTEQNAPHNLEPCLPPPELLYTPANSSNNSTQRQYPTSQNSPLAKPTLCITPAQIKQYRQKKLLPLPTLTSESGEDSAVGMTEDSAATAIQTAYRNFRARKKSKSLHLLPSASGDHRKFEIEKAKMGDSGVKNNHKVLSMFTNNKNLQKSDSKTQIEPLQNREIPIKNETYGALLCKGSLLAQERETVLVFGGLDPHSLFGQNRNTGNNIYRFIPEENRWDYVGEIPEPRHHHSVVFYKNRVWLVGGANPCNAGEKDKFAVNTVWSYCPVKRLWYRETSMITPRRNFGLIAHDKKLYAIGGQDKTGRIMSSVERLEDNGQWVEIAPLSAARMGCACTKHRDYIWVAGGMMPKRKYPVSNLVEYYDHRNNVWICIEPLRIPRCCACLISMNEKLYLIGGAGKITDCEQTTSSIGAVDIWDSKDKEWKLLTEMLIPRHGHSLAYLGTQILVIGGVTTVYMRALSNTECYCVERNTWIRGVSPLPSVLSGHSSVTLPPATWM